MCTVALLMGRFAPANVHVLLPASEAEHLRPVNPPVGTHCYLNDAPLTLDPLLSAA